MHSKPSQHTLASLRFVLTLLGVGFSVGLAGTANAALTSPAVVAAGALVGTTNYDLGTTNVPGWRDENQMNRRMVYVRPVTDGLEYMVAATVNQNDCSGNLCRLEIRQSKDKGLTWAPISNALSPILIDGSSATPKNFDYNLQVGPNGRDVWVAYVKEYAEFTMTSSGFSHTRYIPNAYIRKLTWSTTKATWGYDVAEVRPRDGNNQVNGVDTVDHASTAFAVQYLPGTTTERVWGVVSYHDNIDANPDDDVRRNYLVYCDNFELNCANLGSWIPKKPLISTAEKVSAARSYYQPFAKTVLFSTGSENMPGLLVSAPRFYTLYAGCTDTPGLPVTQFGIEGTGSVAIGGLRGYVWGGTCGDSSLPSGSAGYDFTVATYPTDNPAVYKTVIVNAGGCGGCSEAEYIANAKKIQIQVGTFNTTTETLTLPPGPVQFKGVDLQQEFYSPAVGIAGLSATTSRAYVAARHAGSGVLYVANEDNWAAAAPQSASGMEIVKFAVAMPERIGTGFTLNSGLPPIMWAIADKQRIVFSANVGGTTGAGTSSLLPVMGFGWASNFGWLSMNCASLPITPCGNGLYGVGIGITAASASPPNLPIFSPTSTSTYPLGGYAWSSNAGFLSFERKDSVHTCAGCDPSPDTEPSIDNNTYGNPPGQAYHNSALVTDATAKYDRTNQHVYGWGRFLNLCNYDDADGGGPGTDRVCFDKDAGWVRMRGYWLDVAKKAVGKITNGSVNGLESDKITVNIVGGVCNPLFSPGSTIALQNQYATVTSCLTPLGPPSINVTAYGYIGGTTVEDIDVYSVTGQDYGVDAFWTNNHYEFSGWGWSQEYGWIRFNPLIFIGYAWLESLFGNIYVGENFQLPDAQRLNGDPVSTCDTNGDGTLEPCFVSTYRIEAGGAIAPLSYAPGLSVSSGTSASSTYLESLTGLLGVCGFGSSTAEECSRLLGSPDASLLSRGVSPNTFTFPTVQPSTSTYRNALGKLDVGGLTTSVTTAVPFDDVISGKKVSIGTNRFGHKLFSAEYSGGIPVDWSVGELFGNNFPGGCTGVCLTGWIWPLEKLQNQVVHVQGDLTVGYDPNTANKAETTFTSINRVSEVLDVASTANFPTAGTLIISTSEGREEYLSYTGKASATQFSGVTTVSGVPTSPHIAGDSVRWVWRWPWPTVAGGHPPQNLTVVVDGDLKINYNIIASDTTKDLDLAAAPAPASIKDAQAIAFIVRGDVVIAKEVNRITGAFIVISRDTDELPDTSDAQRSTDCSDTHPLFTGCGGVFDTGEDADPAFCNSSDPACNPLTIEGLLFARRFNFARSGALETIDVPAERVIFDQRLFLNPPPGLEDLTKALPNPTRQIP